MITTILIAAIPILCASCIVGLVLAQLIHRNAPRDVPPPPHLLAHIVETESADRELAIIDAEARIVSEARRIAASNQRDQLPRALRAAVDERERVGRLG